MDKKKAVICTILFSIVMLALYVSLFFIKNKSGVGLWQPMTCCITGLWMGERITKFYNWLTK
jgi:hypothetical protein